MVLNDSKEQFYAELDNKIEKGNFDSDEFVGFIQRFDDYDVSGFYELCSKFADIGLNAPKQADPVTCDVEACFKFSDCDAAKAAFKDFFEKHNLSDVDGVLEAVHLMHRIAVAWDDPRCTGGRVIPKNYDWKQGFGGKYYNFCELPDDIWNKIAEEIRNENK